MNEERVTVLRMVAEKKITAEEGERLLNALGYGSRPPGPGAGARKPDPGVTQNPKRWTFDFGGGKKETRGTRVVLKKTTGKVVLVPHPAGDTGPHDPADVKASFIREMKGLGLSLTADQIVEMKVHGVSPDFVKEMRELGFGDLAVHQLVEMKIHGVNPEFIRQMRDLGLGDLRPDQLTEMKIHGVNPEFVREMQQHGFENLTVEQLVEMKIHGVNPEFILEMREQGFDNLTVPQLVEMKIHGVT